MNKMSIKKGDVVVVLSGKDKGKQGKVLAAMPADRKVIVEGINVVSRHTKPRKQGEEGGILKKDPLFTPARCRRSAPSATRLPAPLTRCWPTARRSASARSAALRSKRGGVTEYG